MRRQKRLSGAIVEEGTTISSRGQEVDRGMVAVDTPRSKTNQTKRARRDVARREESHRDDQGAMQPAPAHHSVKLPARSVFDGVVR